MFGLDVCKKSFTYLQ